MALSHPGFPVDPNRPHLDESPEGTPHGGLQPPPPPSRRAKAHLAAAPAQGAPHVDFNAPTVAASELEQNPFASKSRWRALLKKPSREVIVRGGIALLALGVGIGIGAKPWKASRATPSAKVVAAHAAPKKPQVATQSARANLVAKPAPYRAATPSHAAQTNRFPAPAKPAAAKATTQPNGSKTATSKTATSKTATSKTAAHPAGAKSTTTRTASTATHQK